MTAPDACNWCGDFADVSGPLTEQVAADGSSWWLCEDCLAGRNGD